MGIKGLQRILFVTGMTVGFLGGVLSCWIYGAAASAVARSAGRAVQERVEKVGDSWVLYR